MNKNNIVAPELEGITEWLNSKPLKLSDFKGKVIGLDFWTHSCGNCAASIPKLERLYRKYADKGFVLIGVHSPELPTDKKVEAINEFVKKNHLSFPIAVDNDMMTWQVYNQRYWPTLYLIDKEGYVQSRHIGEGGYDAIEKEIQHLLAN